MYSKLKINFVILSIVITFSLFFISSYNFDQGNFNFPQEEITSTIVNATITYTNDPNWDANESQMLVDCPAGNYSFGIYTNGSWKCRNDEQGAGGGGNTTEEIWFVVNNGTFMLATTQVGNTTMEIWGVVNNNTFMPIGTQVGNTTSEMWAVINNGTFDRYNNYYNSSLINVTTLEDQAGSLSVRESWIVTLWNSIWGTKTTDDLTQGVVNLYDNQSWNQTLANDLYLLNIANDNISILGTYPKLGVNGTWLNNSIDARLISTTYYPTFNKTVYGTESGGNNIENLSFYDLQSYNVTEVTGANPLQILINFTGVISLDYITLRERYSGGQGHEITLYIWDWAGSFWESYYEITDQSSFVVSIIPVLDPVDHISGGEVRIKFNHDSTPGISSHTFKIDFINLVDGHSTITNIEHDSLSGRDDPNNHPQFLLIDGTRNMTGNLSLAGNNLTWVGWICNATNSCWTPTELAIDTDTFNTTQQMRDAINNSEGIYNITVNVSQVWNGTIGMNMTQHSTTEGGVVSILESWLETIIWTIAGNGTLMRADAWNSTNASYATWLANYSVSGAYVNWSVVNNGTFTTNSTVTSLINYNGVFINWTSTTTTGNISNSSHTGYPYANAICNAQYSGSHMCTMDEILKTMNQGSDNTNFTATFRASEGAPGYLANANDCDGWSSQAAADLGSIFVGSTSHKNGYGSGSLVSCSAVRAIGCCK